MILPEAPRKLQTIPEFFEEKGYKSAKDVMEYLFNQYYIYDKHRAYLGSWAAPLRSAVSRDAMHFVEYYENPQYRNHMNIRTRSPWHQTNRVLGEIFADISEVCGYMIDERDDLNEEFMQALYESWVRAGKENFKRKLNGKDEFVW